MVDDEQDLFAVLSDEDMERLRKHDHAAVARRAYEIFQRRGGAPGRDLEDWLQAERELLYFSS